MRKLLIIAVALVAMAVPATASAAGPTTKGAARAVAAKLPYNLSARVHCYRESRTRFYCEYHGLSSADIWRGNTEGTSGSAYVTYYAGRYVARVY
jgi:hypothetical protein